ncbi:MAG: pyruvate kinase [Myxococcales bacterium]|nr:pyruvate kinase [Myxococcales bacterium]
MKRRTKIIATLGPALDSEAALSALLEAGADVLRVNLSHATPRQQLERVQKARRIKPDVAILVDLCGPKLRLGDLPEDLNVHADAELVLGAGGVPVGDPSLYARVRPGDPVYIADGMIALEAKQVGKDFVKCRVLVGGTLRSRKGINLPLDVSSLPCLTDKDRADVADIDVLDPDFVALSYVRHEDDLEELRKLTSLPIVAKIEKQQALDRLDAIVASADAVMVARGDLGVEIPIEKVPASQKRLIREANSIGRPVITATQMLVSMVTNPLPTRAEVTDVANAVLDGTDAVMLSEETAVGRDPAGVVALMARVLSETEPLLGATEGPSRSIPGNAMACAAAKLAEDLDAAAIVAPTRTGVSALRLAAFRPKRPILAYSRVPATTRRLHLAWGVTPIDLTVPAGMDPVEATLEAARRDLPAGSRIVLLDIAPQDARGIASLVNAITL